MASAETVESAKQFLLNRLIEQASQDGVALSDVEKRMFLFSESSANTDWDANEKFEAEYDDSEYEKKVTKLLRRAHSRDVKSSATKSGWRECLRALNKEDFYGLVMIDRAKISRPKSLSGSLSTFDAPSIYLMLLQLGILTVAFAILLNRIGSRFFASDGARLGTFLFLVVIGWGLGDMYRRWDSKRAVKALQNFSQGDGGPKQ